jgi:hypothetical protein
MLEKEINKEDINILHWHIISSRFRCFFEHQELFYEINISVNFTDKNPSGISFNDNDKSVKDFIMKNIKFCEDVSLSEILNDEDQIMVHTKLFKSRVIPYIKKSERNKKINKIVYGS